MKTVFTDRDGYVTTVIYLLMNLLPQKYTYCLTTNKEEHIPDFVWQQSVRSWDVQREEAAWPTG